MPQKHTALTKQNLQIYPTERLTDADDGGGLMVKDALTGRENELFTPISDVARTIGAFNARSVHGAVRVADNIPLGGAHMIISRPPKAENVSYLLYRGVRYGEVRRDIIKRIAAYSVATIESRMTLLSTQSQGSRIVQAYQRPGEPLPLIGDVYCLRQDKAGHPAIEQYVQVIRVSSEDRTFTTHDGIDFVRTVVKMETSTASPMILSVLRHRSATTLTTPAKSVRPTSPTGRSITGSSRWPLPSRHRHRACASPR